ncbi:hypothetical protein Celaphus_00016724, partial [Cervus elaphus hippelaphus]
TSLQVIGMVGVVVVVIPWIAVPVIPLGIIFFFLRRYFLETSRDVKRLESSTQSPVFSHLTSSLQGLWTIRAYKAEQRFQELFDSHQDLHSEAWFLLLSITRWFTLRLDVIYLIFVSLVDFGSLLLAQTLNVGQVGLILSYALNILVFPWCIRLSVEVENMMISVERVIEYTELEQEAPWELKFRPPPDWPNEGMIALSNVNFKYSSDGPLVLKDLTIDIKPGEKLEALSLDQGRVLKKRLNQNRQGSRHLFPTYLSSLKSSCSHTPQDSDWPNNGMIALSNVNFKYSSDGPLVLKDLTPDIKPGEK